MGGHNLSKLPSCSADGLQRHSNTSRIVGQTRTCQIDGLADLGKELGNGHNRLWKMKNGYCLAKTTGLEEITRRLNAATSAEWRK